MDQIIPEKRKTRRSNVLLAAMIEYDGTSLPVKLRNLSAEGALISGNPLPESGTAILFCRNDLAVQSRIMWVYANHAGVMFGRPLPKSVILQHLPKPPDRPMPAFSGRPGFTCRTLTEEEKSMIEEWATASSTRLGAWTPARE